MATLDPTLTALRSTMSLEERKVVALEAMASDVAKIRRTLGLMHELRDAASSPLPVRAFKKL